MKGYMGYEYYFEKTYDTWYDATFGSRDRIPGFNLQWHFDINIPYDEKYSDDNIWMLYVR